MTTSTATVALDLAESLDLDPGIQFASGNISYDHNGDFTLSASIVGKILSRLTPEGGTFVTEEEIPEILGALEIAAQVHATCGNAIQSANYQAIYSDLANRYRTDQGSI